jgi:outer membrane protein OmpA-like peptidoglycan-associated protein
LLDAIEIAARGVGSTSPATSGVSEQDKQQNRRVSFRVFLPDAAEQRSGRS